MRRAATIGVLAVALLLVGGVAVASIPDSAGVIHGCRRTTSGELRVIDSATQTCPSGWAPLNWSQTGPAGPAGAVGPAGPQGPPGPVAIRTVLDQGFVSMSAPVGSAFSVSAGCGEGVRPTGGGYDIEYSGSIGGTPPVSVNATFPETYIWKVKLVVAGTLANEVTVSVYAQCPTP